MDVENLRRRLEKCLEELDELGLSLAAARLDMAILALDQMPNAPTLRDNMRDYEPPVEHDICQAVRQIHSADWEAEPAGKDGAELEYCAAPEPFGPIRER